MELLAVLWALGILCSLIGLLNLSRQILDKMGKIGEVTDAVRALKSVAEDVEDEVRLHRKYVMMKDGVDELDFYEMQRGFQEWKKDKIVAEFLAKSEKEGSAMKCDQCDKDDVPAKRRHLVGPDKGRNEAGVPVNHYECESGHRFHFPAFSGEGTKQQPCTCPD